MLISRRPHRLTPDSLVLLFLLKINEGLSDNFLGFLTGTSPQAVNSLIRRLRDFIFKNDPFLQRQRNLNIDS